MLGIVALIVAGILLLAGLVVVGMRNESGADPLERRLAEYGDRELPTSLEELELSLSLQERVIVPMYKTLANFAVRFTPENQIDSIRHQLELAGKLQSIEPTTFFGQRVALTIGFGVGAFVLFFLVSDWGPTKSLLGTICAALLGYYLPVLQLRSQIRRRQDSITRALPNALDLLCICVEAGLGFEQAMGKVYEKWDDELAIAFGRVLQEIQLGKRRSDALRDMSNRMDVADVTSFVAALIQAEQLGVSIAKILRIQADQMRVKRRQRAQEKAQQAPVKMVIPMVLLIFPSLYIVLLGPAAIILLESGVFGAI
ncbi:type II secretion system F family protein [Aggregatilinea lenta]|uniref:type II secretion system F family protein n=1 Tax=Aggregatilinea lenta TaxID=913108 RepID=UPI000E5B8F4B|nr:type II secretion system F family protein [Aggregatilinea lenta]